MRFTLKNNNIKNNLTVSFQKINRFWFYFFPFVILSIPVIVIILTNNIPEVEGYYSMHYVLNYSRGYVGRGLVGEVLSWFFDILTRRVINICNMVFTELLVISASLCIGKSLEKTRENDESFLTVLFFILFLCFADFTVGIYYEDIKMDKLIWALTLFSLYCLENKFLTWLIPFFSIASVLINPVYCFTGFLLVAVALLYNFQNNSYSFKSGFILITTCFSVVLVTGVAPFAQTHLNFKDANEFLDYYYSRTDIELSQYVRNLFADEWLFEYFAESPQSVLRDTFNTYFVNWDNGGRTVISTVFLALPAFSVNAVFWLKNIKKETDKVKKFVFFVCMIAFVVIIPAIVLSWEATKYYGNYLFVQLALVIWFLSQKDDTVIRTVGDYKRKIKNNPLGFAAIAGYFMTVLMVK